MMKKGLLLVLAAMLLLSMSVTAFAAPAPSVSISNREPQDGRYDYGDGHLPGGCRCAGEHCDGRAEVCQP